MPLLEIKGVSVGYAGAAVLQAIDATLEAGEIARRNNHRGVARIGGQRFSKHHARFRPWVGVLLVGHARGDNAIAGERLANIAERVGLIPNVRPAAARPKVLS